MRGLRNRQGADFTQKCKIFFGLIFAILLPSFTVVSRAELGPSGLACLSNPCIYGICIDNVNSTFLCYCIDGYTGLLCQTNWDECWSNPCLNGGTCNDGIAQYNCTCPQGYQGDLCEQNINECDSNPCRNNGTCIDGSNGYTCVCPLGYLGDLCETDISVCNDTVETKCLNGGYCVEGPGLAFKCICPLGWSGHFCENTIDECLSSPCENGAICLDLQANYICVCPFGFTGQNCEVELEMCGDSSPCQNGALCMVEDWLRVCYCVPDFHGERCQFQYNECLLGPGCQNGGTCIDGVDGYDCSCSPGWTGNFCECLIVSEDKMDCNFLLPPTYAVHTTTPREHHTLSISTKTQVPKKNEVTPLPPKSVSTKKPIYKYFFPFVTQCFPIWPQITVPPQDTETEAPQTSTEKEIKEQTKKTELMQTTNILKDVWTPIFTPKTTASPPSTTTTHTTTTTTSTSTSTTTKSTISPLDTQTTSMLIVTSNKQTTVATPMTKEITQTTTSKLTAFTTSMITSEEPTETLIANNQITESTEVDWKNLESTTEVLMSEATASEKNLSTVTQTGKKIHDKRNESLSITTEMSTTLVSKVPSLLVTQNITEHSDFVPTTISSPPLRPRNCKPIICLNGGTCLNTTYGPKCLCKSIWEGQFCSSKTDIKIVGFSKNSYVSHRLSSTYNIRIDLTARTVVPMGTILHSHFGPNIFMTLYLEDGLLKFKFSCGVQTMVLSEVQYLINNGYDFIITIALDFVPRAITSLHCAATVRINNTLAMSGEQLTKRPNLDSGSSLIYIGGLPSQYFDSEEIPVPEGFVGCIHSLMINNVTKGIFKDSYESAGVSECKFLACLSNPCRSGSTCVEHNNTWTCLCPSGFLGQYCENSVCNNNPCQFGGTCVQFPGSGFICLCPLKKQGLFCENSIETDYPLFASSIGGLSSFAAYKIPTEIYQDMQLTFKFIFHDVDQISLMVFMGQDGYHGITSDHLAVSFIKGYIVLTWNLGSGPRRIFTPHPISYSGRLFHTVHIGRTGQRAWLVVDDQKNITGKSPGKLSQLNTRSILYLGGHESKNFSLLPHDLPLHTGFSGCLFDVELRMGQMLIKIDKSSPVYSRGISQCGSTMCNERSCENGGGCIDHGATFTCLCRDGWFGPTCAMKYNPCDTSRHNCSEGSTCVPLQHEFACDCPLGKTGKFCEKNEELSDIKFKGVRSYISLPAEGLYQYQSCIDLEIKPVSNFGLILYSGRPEGNSFWSLSLQDGIIELRILTGLRRRRGDLLLIKSKRILGMGKWHRIRAGRYGKRLFLWVEGVVSTGILLPGENLSPSGAIIYIGGAPDLSKLPLGVTSSILQPFVGCIRKFGSRYKEIPLTKNSILEGRNVEDCDGTACGGDYCHNGGTCHIGTLNEPFCTCSKQYVGKRCEYRISCKQMNCQNKGRCTDNKNWIPHCNCPNGWGGAFCESALSVHAPQFAGNSYILINRMDSAKTKKRDTGNNVDIDFIYLNFTTPEPNGLLLWSSNENNTEFLGIGIENEKVKLVWKWEMYNTTVVVSNKFAADGAWHDIAVNFDLMNITIWMDENIIYESNDNNSSQPIATNGKLFLGGFPDGYDMAQYTFKHFHKGFSGCLQQLKWQVDSSIYNFSKYEGENIRTCDPFGIT